MNYWERYKNPVIPPIESSGVKEKRWNFDDYYEEYYEALKNNDCMTCKHHKNMGCYSECILNRKNQEYKEIPEYSGPVCTKGGRKNKWEPKVELDIDHHFMLNNHINEKNDTDLYEIYEYETGRGIMNMELKWRFFLFIPYLSEEIVRIPEILYYIVKNKKYYLCNSGEWKGYRPKEFNNFYNPRGFLPLTDFRRILHTPYLCTFDDYDKAVGLVNTLDCQKMQRGNIVYSNENTIDTLTQKFIELENEDHLAAIKDDKIRNRLKAAPEK